MSWVIFETISSLCSHANSFPLMPFVNEGKIMRVERVFPSLRIIKETLSDAI